MTAELVEMSIDTTQSNNVTQEEQALGFFARWKLKTLSTLNLWHQGETKQLNQFEALQMFDEPALADKRLKPVTPGPHCQCNVKQDGPDKPGSFATDHNAQRQCCMLWHQLTIHVWNIQCDAFSSPQLPDSMNKHSEETPRMHALTPQGPRSRLT